MIAGKLIAGLLGLLVGGVPGLIVGVVLGHLFDRGLARVLGVGGDLEHMREIFFRTTFSLMGHLAKADGRVSEEEVAHTEAVFQQLGLAEEQRMEAILRFKEGTDADFSLEDTVQTFLQEGGAHRALKQTLMMFLLALALADRSLDQGEHEVLSRIGALLGYSPAAVAELLRMATAQEQFHRQSGVNTSAPTLDDAYSALGVLPTDSDAVIKRAYRKLMSQHHPDKLSARGVPEDMLKLATEKAQEIQAAYEMIRKVRGTGRSG
ncbi:MAG: DnaJ like chaperone protein [Halieaceae bacterium]